MSATRKKVYGTATISDGGDDNCGNIYDDGVDVGDGCVCICVSIISPPFVFVVVVLYGMKREKLDKSEKVQINSSTLHTRRDEKENDDAHTRFCGASAPRQNCTRCGSEDSKCRRPSNMIEFMENPQHQQGHDTPLMGGSLVITRASQKS